MSPRRSSRARTSQPNPSPQQQTNSSSSSTTSGRVDRGARSNLQVASPRSSIATRSLSSEEIEGSAKPPPRRTRSSQEDKNEDINVHPRAQDDEEGEEEVTRCICGNLDYLGMPVLPGNSSKSRSKSSGGPGLAGSPSTLPEDAGGLFIQCDVCKVWQHGGCVGIMEEAMSPEEYFCERCRKDLHKITTSINGQRYSRYLPVQELPSSQSSPTPPAHDNSTKKPGERRSSRANQEPQASKRRATMNSRDSAYDEAEQLRRAIEESKREVASGGADVSGRKGKRSRSDSSQRKDDTKRQRTTSSSSPSDGKTLLADAGSEDENATRQKSREGGQSKIRGAAAQNHRNKQLREQEEKREKERAEAAGRRKARSERRRADDLENSPEPLGRTLSKTLNAEPPQSSAKSTPPALKTSHHKKTGRPPAKRGRVGRNQYSKDRDPPQSSLANADLNTSPANSNGSAADDGTPHINGTNSPLNHTRNGQDAGGLKSKLKHLNPNRTSMNDMKRRVAAILEYISRTQVEMATNGLMRGSQSTTITPPDSGSSKDSTAPKLLEGQALLEELDIESFVKLSSVEMMEVLTRRLMKWQMEYGKWGEK